MASSKDVYEAGVYKPNVYASGVFRGSGTTVVLVYGPLCVADGAINVPGITDGVLNIPGAQDEKLGCADS